MLLVRALQAVWLLTAPPTTQQGCLAFKTQAEVEASTQRKRQVKQSGASKTRKRERALGALAPVPGDAAGGACRVCARGTHGANKCPLRTVLEVSHDGGDETDDQRWAEALDEPMRQVLLAVQQLASAQMMMFKNKQGPKPRRPAPYDSLSAQHLRAIQDVLTRDLARPFVVV